MFYIHEALTTKAQQELNRRNIAGEVVRVRFVSKSGCAMIRIGFISETTPSPVLSTFEFLEHQDDEYYLYLPIDVTIYNEK